MCTYRGDEVGIKLRDLSVRTLWMTPNATISQNIQKISRQNHTLCFYVTKLWRAWTRASMVLVYLQIAFDTIHHDILLKN